MRPPVQVVSAGEHAPPFPVTVNPPRLPVFDRMMPFAAPSAGAPCPHLDAARNDVARAGARSHAQLSLEPAPPLGRFGCNDRSAAGNGRATHARQTGAVKKILPYVLVETFLPGGSLIALGMWLYQNRERLPKWRRTSSNATTPSPSTT